MSSSTPPAPSHPIITVSNATKVFGGRFSPKIHALKGINLTIHPGEIISLLGANGAGKSTLIDLILGLTTPTSGHITSTATIGAVLQTGGLLHDITVEATIRMIAATYDTHIPITQLLEHTNLTNIRKRKVGTCSGGEQQRLRFALALLSDPDILILDEPTAGMDAVARRQFWNTLNQQAAHGRTIIFATHYLEEAQNYAQRVVVLASGHVISDGTVDEIRNLTSGQTVTAEFPGSPPSDVPGAIEITTNGHSAHITTQNSDAVARHLLGYTDAYNLRITANSLEDSFFALTQQPNAQQSGTETANPATTHKAHNSHNTGAQR